MVGAAHPDRRVAPRHPPVRRRGLRAADHDLRALHHRRHRRAPCSSRTPRLTKRGGEPWIILDISLWAVVFGIIGARFYHVLTHPDDYFGPGKNVWNPFEPGSIWAIWEGGGAIFGSLIGGALGVYIGCRIAGLRFWSVADAIAPGAAASPRRSAGSATSSTRSSSACRPTCRGASRSTAPTRRSRPASATTCCSTRRSSTR